MSRGRMLLFCVCAAAAALLACIVCLAVRGDGSGISKRAARRMLSELETIAVEQHAAAAAGSGSEARMALNLAVKAEYAISRADDGKFTAAQKTLLRDTLLMLRTARAAIEAGESEIPEEKGGRLRAYVSEIDGTVQTYSVSVPAGYDPELKWPLIVSMHGHGWYGRFQGHPAPSYSGAICLSPQGRGATDYKELGEDDVMAAISEVKRDFSIDEDRVYLTGVSMGGTGAFSIASHYADQFAAILPVCGNSDNRVWTENWGWNKKYEGRDDDLRKKLQDRHSALNCAVNLINMPMFVIAGSADKVVPPGHSRNVVELLRSYGAPRLEYREFPNCGHGGYPKESVADAMAWMCSWKRDPEPKSIYWKAFQLRYGKAWWTRMEQFEGPLSHAVIKASASQGRIDVETFNLLSFSLQRPVGGCGTGAVSLWVDGREVRLRRPLEAHSWVTLRRDPIHGWLDAVDAQNPGIIKRSGFEGPVSDVLREPFTVVIGTTSPVPGMVEAWKREAEAFSNEWERRNGAPCRVITDRQCSLEDMRKYNMILFGGARDNSASELVGPFMPLSGIFSLLPVKNEDPGEGRRGLESEDLGSFLMYPNVEYAPDRLVVMISANSPQAAFQCWGRFGNWFNWGVYDSAKYFDYAVYDARSVSPETMLLEGWFGTDWSIEGGVYRLGNEKLRSTVPVQKYPDVHLLEDMEDETLPLVRLMPSKIDHMRGALGLGRGFFGEDLKNDNSIGVRAPCVIEYELDGSFCDFTSVVKLVEAREMTLRGARRKAEKVSFKLYGDERLLQERTISWDEPEARISSVVRSVKKLRLEVKPAGGPSWQHSGAAWVDPVLWRGNAPAEYREEQKQIK